MQHAAQPHPLQHRQRLHQPFGTGVEQGVVGLANPVPMPAGCRSSVPPDEPDWQHSSAAQPMRKGHPAGRTS
jgi:hypothetical protein